MGRVPGIRLTVEDESGVVAVRDLGQVDGWGQTRVGSGSLPLMPNLPTRGHRAQATVAVSGPGPWTVRWHSTRAGSGALRVTR